MSDPKKVIPIRPDPTITDDTMIVQLSVAELRLLIRAELDEAIANRSDDRLIDIEECAKMLCVSTDWIYHARKRLPFARKIGRKQLRFSVKEMRKWMDARRG